MLIKNAIHNQLESWPSCIVVGIVHMIPTTESCTDVMLLNLRITHHYIDPYPYHHAFLDLEVHQDQQQMVGPEVGTTPNLSRS